MSDREKTNIKRISGGVTAPKGFKAAGVVCGIKQSGNKDVAILVSDTVAIAAAVFTTSKMSAAPVHVSRKHLESGKAKAVVINSGNANAATGGQGEHDAREMADLTAGYLNIAPEEVIVCSTGIIGVQLPMEKVGDGIKAAIGELSGDGGAYAAEAIMTTDTFQKEYAIVVEIDGQEVKIGGMAKGSGMIAPNMATMLAFVTTDVQVSLEVLQELLKKSVEKSFNSITVDGDTSTNDTLAVLANGESGVHITGDKVAIFQAALDEVCIELAKMIVRDGEGATKFIEVNVVGAVSDADAKKAAMAIANSNLVKTAFFGQDANWGRIVCAAGYSSCEMDQGKIDVYYGDERLVEDGNPIAYNLEKVDEILKAKDITIQVDLKLGSGTARVWTCDFSYDYVKINAEYHT